MAKGTTSSRLTQNDINLALLNQKVSDVQVDVTEIKTKLEGNYATKEWVEAEYGPSRKLLNAMLIAFALALVSAFAAFVLQGGLRP